MNESQKKKHVSPKYVFLHILSIITLYFAAVSFITLLFQYINILIPDKAFISRTFLRANLEGLRFAISSLVVVFPVYLATTVVLNKGYLKDPAKRDGRLRKWLIYLTLFIAALVMIGDLVASVNTYLRGDITIRFILKALSILLVIGAIFLYYLGDVRRKEPSKSLKKFVWTISVVVGVAVVGGFILAGSPQKERLRKLDQERRNDLANIQWEIVNYWQKKEVLPAELSQLEDDISGFRVPADPESKEAYEYTAKEEKTFELCGTFGLASPGPEGDYYSKLPGGGFEHVAGRNCFDRTIDEDLYPKDKDLRALRFPVRE